MRVPIELVTSKDVQKFTEICQTVNEEVRLVGKDENGDYWDLSAKSLFCSLILAAKKQCHREHTAHDVDWNTIWCVCERDITNLISAYIKGK